MANTKTPMLDNVIVEDKFVHVAGEDELLRQYTLGGPTCGRNIQMILDVDTLELLLSVAKASADNRATIFNAGVQIKVRRTRSGDIYETLHIVGSQPRARTKELSLGMPVGPAQSLANNWKKRW